MNVTVAIAELQYVVLLTQLQGLTHDREELLREAAIMAQFVHANVIRLVGVVTVGEPLMIVLEYAGELQHPTYKYFKFLYHVQASR